MEFHQSSLLGLKAELLRKRQEVEHSKSSAEFSQTPSRLLKIKNEDTANKGTAYRPILEEREPLSEDLLEKSLKVLQAKAKLYEKLMKNRGEDPGVNIGGILVNFQRKLDDDDEEEEDDVIEEFKDGDEGDWVDFIDCLGRTKRCLKEDLEAMKKQDEELKKGLFGDNPPPLPPPPPKEQSKGEPDLMSADMQREMLRKKWEAQEQELLGRREVHYQDLLFDEARTHGVGYYSFSRDEEERQRQQKNLLNLRKETLEHQKSAKFSGEQKKEQMKKRLLAAKKRRRERLGLPEQEEEVEEPERQSEKPEEPEPEETPEGLERSERRANHVREWDLGKDKEKRVLTQDEWVDLRRKERPSEFAPPNTFEPVKKSRRVEKKEQPEKLTDIAEKQPQLEKPVKHPKPEGVATKFEPGRSRAEIPPPSCLLNEQLPTRVKGSHSMENSIDEGLQFLRKQVETKQAKRSVDMFDIM